LLFARRDEASFLEVLQDQAPSLGFAQDGIGVAFADVSINQAARHRVLFELQAIPAIANYGRIGL
jgi:hypothetical protein